MLYQIGTVSMDTRPFNVDDVSIKGSSSLPQKPVLGSLRPIEFTGDDGYTITLSGQILPTKIGGLSGVEALNQMRANGITIPVVRGDGRALGWYSIKDVSEKHSDLVRSGVGFVVKYTVTLIQAPGPAGGGIAGGTGIISALVGLFNAIG